MSMEELNHWIKQLALAMGWKEETPNPYTLLDRLKTLNNSIGSMITKIENLLDKYGTGTEEHTVIKELEDVTSAVEDLSQNRIGSIDTENTLNWLLNKIRGAEAWRVKSIIDLMDLWDIVTTNESFMCFIGETNRVVFRNFWNGTNNIGQIIIPYTLISAVWGVPSGYTTDARGFAWDGSHLWVLIFNTSGYLKLCRVVDYTVSWVFDREYSVPDNTFKGLVYRNGKLITYCYGTGSPPYDFYEVDPDTGTFTKIWSTSEIYADAGGITYDDEHDWLIIIQPRGYGGLYVLSPTNGQKILNLSILGTLSGGQLYGVGYNKADKCIWTDNGTIWRQMLTINTLNVGLLGLTSSKNLVDVLVNDEGRIYVSDIGDTALQNASYSNSIANILYNIKNTDGIKKIVDTVNISNPPNLDVALSTRASETTLSNIKAKTDNLDVALSTRLAEATFIGRFPSAQALSDNLANPTTTLVGAPVLGWDGGSSVWRRLQCDSSGRLKVCFA